MAEKAAVEKIESPVAKQSLEKTLEKRRALGRGLESLLPSGSRVAAINAPRPAAVPAVQPAAAHGTDQEAVEPVARPERVEDQLPHEHGSPSAAVAGLPAVDRSALSGLAPLLHSAELAAAAAPAQPPTGEDARRSINADGAARLDGRGRPSPHELSEPVELQAQAAHRDVVLHIPVTLLEPNPYQTRQRVDESYLKELADSITANGVLQPVIVRPGREGRFTLIAGECRWRASKLADKTTIPAIVREVSNQQALEMTIIENLQRQDLNCWEQAQAFGRLAKEFQLTQEEIAKRTGLERSSVANYMRLLKLPVEVQELLRQGQLEFGQAKVLMSLDDPEVLIKVATKAAKREMSVRELEDWVFDIRVPIEGEKPKKRYDPNVMAAQDILERQLGVRVRIRDRNGKGKIVIEYKSLEDFDRVVEALGKE